MLMKSITSDTFWREAIILLYTFVPEHIPHLSCRSGAWYMLHLTNYTICQQDFKVFTFRCTRSVPSFEQFDIFYRSQQFITIRITLCFPLSRFFTVLNHLVINQWKLDYFWNKKYVSKNNCRYIIGMYFPGVHGNHSRLNYYIMMSCVQNGQTEDNKIGVCCMLPYKTHSIKQIDLLARNQDNVSEWWDMFTRGLLS